MFSSGAPHFGEEPALSGTHLPKGQVKGTGNIFFGRCNLRCVYCQNWQISQGPYDGQQLEKVGAQQLSEIMLNLQAQGCHNIGLVSPTHFVPQIVEALSLAVEAGLHLPLVYNTNSYDSVQMLRQLDGIVDVYLPDLKYSDNETATKYSTAIEYVRHSRAAVEEMYRQVGHELVLDSSGLLRRGLVVRLLILPNDLAGLRDTLLWIRERLSPRVSLSVMTQFYPAHKVDVEQYPLLSRKINASEYARVLGWLDEFGFENGWVQPLEEEAPSYYRPDFSDRRVPFQDARDFA